MSKIQKFGVLVGLLAAANAWGAPFKDDFNRADGAPGNGWTVQTNGTITVQIANNEVLIAGTEGAAAWTRAGITRTVVGETKVSCDFKADDTFNMHLRIQAAGSPAWCEVYAWAGGPFSHANSLTGSWPAGPWTAIPNSDMVAGKYNNISLEKRGTDIIFSLNGKEVIAIPNSAFTTIGTVQIASDADANQIGSLHIDNVLIGKVIPGKAKDPNPDSVSDVPRDTALSWTAGDFAKTHDVYLGQTLADVNTADLSKAVSKGQAQSTFKPAAPLEYGKTYYWRVDEVNAAPSNTVFKGDVWSFTVEPYAYPIPAASITATASSSDKSTTGPANTINGSGLTNDLHSTSSTAMWATSMTSSLPGWIQYQFNKAYKLQELWVWNHNTEMEPVLGTGFKDVTIEYSLDGTTWTLLKDMQFAQAPALPGYAHNTTVDMGGVMAQYVRLTARSNYSIVGLKQCGLSEVRFYYIPTDARAPQPAMNAKDVSIGTSLDWRQGRDVTSQKVYLGTDKAAVTNGTATVNTVTNHGFVPAALDFGTTYYWKVDEVGAATYPGDVWKFVTQEFSPVDNFENYTDQAGAEVFTAWVDGMTNGNGSIVGLYPDAIGGTFCEKTIVHGGNQSMPFEYNNVKAPFYSEAERTFDTPQDWTGNGATALSLWFQGYPAMATVPVNVTAAGALTLTGDGTDIWNNSDDFIFAYKTLTGDGSIVARVIDKGTGTNPWGKGGVMIRGGLTGGATFADMLLSDNSDGSASYGYSFQWRPTTNASATSTDGVAPTINVPYWVKVQRVGDTLAGYISADGKTWKQYGSPQTVALGPTVYVGLCVTSGVPGELRTFKFDGIATTGNVGSTWQGAAIVGARNNVAAPLYVTVEDKAGKKKTVVNPDAAAVNKAAWTQWQIAFSDLAGVNLAAVKKLTLGVGDRTNPKAGGGGKLYIDDIAFGKPAVRDMTNYAVNGGFETGVIDPWYAGGGGGQTTTATVVTACAGAAVAEGPVEGKYCLNVKVSGPSTNFWDCAFNMDGPTFVKGTKYTLSAFFKTKSGTGKVNFKPEHAGGNWEGYGEKQITITDKWTEYYVTTPVFTADVTPTSLTFHIGFQAQEFWVDNIKFYEGDYVPTK